MSKKQPVMSHDPLAAFPATDEPVDAAPPAESSVPARDGDAAAITLPVSMTIADVGELHESLSNKLSEGQKLCLDGSEVEIADGAGMQLLAALFKEAGERQLAVEWTQTSDVLTSAAAQIGLSEILKFQSVQPSGQQA